MRTIKTATAVYTGGNIWLFFGTLEDGNYFLTDDYGSTQILNADPSDLDTSLFAEWHSEHLVEELENENRFAFCEQLLDFILEHINDTEISGGMTETEIAAYREFFQLGL